MEPLPEPREGYDIYDIAPTILKWFGLGRGEDMIGESII